MLVNNETPSSLVKVVPADVAKACEWTEVASRVPVAWVCGSIDWLFCVRLSWLVRFMLGKLASV